MLIVLSPAKSLDFETPPATALRTVPDHLPRSAELIGHLRRFSPPELASLMDLSDTLSSLNVGRYAAWTGKPDEGKAAVLAFDGDVYDGLDARSLKPKHHDYLQRQVRILSGLYGILRPFDAIEPHRLEMGTRLANAAGKDLYAFWGETQTRALNALAEETGAAALVNLASEEYFKSVKPRQLKVPVITPVFEDCKNGRYKIISFFAKRARGLMARYAVQKGITDPAKLKSFNVDGYKFAKKESSETEWVFRRNLEA
ncbi:MAG TPA: peroxide stress protein YaaA [Telluria sp.]|nr:peroxide stress protein YaaA [Telluria sp.]